MKTRRIAVTEHRRQAQLFAALGDETRLSLLGKLGAESSLSITQLAEGSGLTRQAITKHLRVLETAELVSSRRHGRESVFRVEPATLKRAEQSLHEIAHQWDDALARLKQFVEHDSPSD